MPWPGDTHRHTQNWIIISASPWRWRSHTKNVCNGRRGGGWCIVQVWDDDITKIKNEQERKKEKKNPFRAGGVNCHGWTGSGLMPSHFSLSSVCVCVCVYIFPIPRDVVVHDQTRSIDTLYYYYIPRCRHLLITWHSILPIFFFLFFFFHLWFFFFSLAHSPLHTETSAEIDSGNRKASVFIIKRHPSHIQPPSPPLLLYTSPSRIPPNDDEADDEDGGD